MTNYQTVSTTQSDSGNEQRAFTFKATQLIWLGLGLLQGLLALRIFLKVIGANPASPFAALLYGLTDPFLLPFAGLVGTPAVGASVFEASALIAMVVYGLLAWGLERLVWVIFYRPRGLETVSTQTTTTEKLAP